MTITLRAAQAVVCLGALALLAGCGKGGAASGASAGLAGPHWNEADACKTLDSAAVQAATGQPVKEATVTTTSAKSDTSAALSTCTYSLASGTVVLMTRVTNDDLTDAQIEEMRTGGGMMPAGEAVPGLGMAAFYSAQTKQLQLFVDRKHYAGIAYGPAMTLPGAPAPAGPDPKAVTSELAKKLL